MPYPKGSKLSPEHRRRIGEAVRRANTHSKYTNREYVENVDSLRLKAEIEKKLGVHCILITAAVMRRMVRYSPTHQVLCRRCTRLFKIGDIVVPRNCGYRVKRMRRRYYHTDCWESMFIDVED